MKYYELRADEKLWNTTVAREKIDLLDDKEEITAYLLNAMHEWYYFEMSKWYMTGGEQLNRCKHYRYLQSLLKEFGDENLIHPNTRKQMDKETEAVRQIEDNWRALERYNAFDN